MPSKVDMDLKVFMIKHQQCFSELTEEEAQTLAGMLIETHFHAKESIVIESAGVNSIYFIVSGTVDVRHVSMENQKVNIESVATLGPKDVIGLNEKGFYSSTGKRTATVVANTDLVTYRLSISDFYRFSQSSSHVSEVMQKYVESFLWY
jgi:CRP-like cAMP-binding protein